MPSFSLSMFRRESIENTGHVVKISLDLETSVDGLRDLHLQC